MPSINLFWRGIAITIIPLLLQLTIIAFLAHYLLMLKNEIVMESRSQEIIARAFVLNRDAMETIYNLNFVFETFAPLERYHPTVRAQPPPLTALNNNLQCLFNVARVDSEAAGKMKELLSCHRQLVSLYNDAHGLTFKTDAERDQAKQIYLSRFVECGRDYANATSAIVEMEEARQAHRPALIHELLDKVWNLLWVALGLSAALAVILGYAFIVQVKRPLKRTYENGLLLAQLKPLPPPLHGNDELAALDKLIYSTAEALEQIQKDEQTLVENAADLICSLSEEGTFLNANSFAFRMLGRSPESLVGRNLNELTVPEETFTCDERLRQARRSTDISVFDLRLLTPNKDIIDTRWSCFWSDAQKAFFCVAHDISETKNAERIKQDLVDMISHDLRSPLTSVSISLAILSRGAKGELPKEEKEKIDLAGKTVEQLIELVTDLLDYQRLNANSVPMDIGNFSIKELIENAVRAIEEKADDKGVSIDISGESADIHGDKKLLLQAISAALSNSIQSSQPGTVTRIELTAIGDTVQVRIVDQGKALSEDEIALLGLNTPTHKLSSSANRSLLKYSICKQIIEAHKGSANFYNVKPQGFSVTARLPVVASAAGLPR